MNAKHEITTTVADGDCALTIMVTVMDAMRRAALTEAQVEEYRNAALRVGSDHVTDKVQAMLDVSRRFVTVNVVYL